MNSSKARELFLGIVNRVHASTTLIIGAVIVVGSIIGASFIPAPTLTAVVAAAGGVLGMLVAYPALVKMIIMDNPRVNTEETVRTLNTLHGEKEQLVLEIERLRNQRLRIESVVPTVELCVLSVNTKLTDVKRIFWDEAGQEVGETQPHIAKYLGILEKRFTAKFGPDLTRLRVLEAEGDRLMIYGFLGEFRGLSNIEKNWPFCEILEARFVPMKLGDKFVIADGHGRGIKESHKQEKELLDRINNGQEFAHLADGIGKVAKQVIELLLSPIGKRLVFEESTCPDGAEPLLVYLDKHRQRLSQNLTGAEDRLKSIQVSLEELSWDGHKARKLLPAPSQKWSNPPSL